MGNIITYLKWRGDISFEERAFNIVDNLVFSYLVYQDFSSVVGPDFEGEGVLLKTAIEKLKEDSNEKIFNEQLLKGLLNSKRFEKVLLKGCVEKLEHASTQFAAITFVLETGESYIAIRGTDNSIIGWQEDFSMCFEKTKAQELACDYIDLAVPLMEGPVYIGGHSKGGTLALYAAMEAVSEIQDKITVIYSNDGTGICPEFMNLHGYNRIIDKLVKTVPEFCIIGALFDREPATYVVKSGYDKFAQHDMFSWLVVRDELELAKDIAPGAKTINKVFDQWIENQDLAHRKKFTNKLFLALQRGGEKFMDEIAQNGYARVEDILFEFTDGNPDTKHTLHSLFGAASKHIAKVDIGVFKDRGWIRKLVDFAVGLLFLITPRIGVKAVGVICFLLIFAYSISRVVNYLIEYKNGKELQKRRIGFFTGLAFLTVLGIATETVVVVSVNLIIAVIFAFRAYRGLSDVIHKHKRFSVIYWLTILDAVVNLGLGAAALVMTDGIVNEYIRVLGLYICLVTIAEVVIHICKKKHNRI